MGKVLDQFGMIVSGHSKMTKHLIFGVIRINLDTDADTFVCLKLVIWHTLALLLNMERSRGTEDLGVQTWILINAGSIFWYLG